MSISVLDVTNALIVDDAQRQNAVHHGLTVDDVAIEQHSWVRNFFIHNLWSRPSPKLRGPREIPSRTVPDICDDAIQNGSM